MNAKNIIIGAILCLTVSVVTELSMLSGIISIENKLYFSWHIILMGLLIALQVLFCHYLTKNNVNYKYSLLLAIGMIFTAIGDYVNSGISSVEPVSNKLTMAVFLFGTGYILYNYILCSYTYKLLQNKKRDALIKYRYLMAIPLLMINLISWFTYIENNLKNFEFLHHSAFVFNATIYVAMPLFAMWYYYLTHWSIHGLIIAIAAFLIPYSDLVLFGSWMKDGQNPAFASIQNYSTNWILYYSGQALMSMLPAFITMDESPPSRGDVI